MILISRYSSYTNKVMASKKSTIITVVLEEKTNMKKPIQIKTNQTDNDQSCIISKSITAVILFIKDAI